MGPDVAAPAIAGGRALHAVIQQQRLPAGGYALFFVTGEGRFHSPLLGAEPIEETTGYLLDRHGRVFFFALGWSEQERAIALTEWRQVEVDPRWARSPEYRQARERLGLPV